MFSFFAQNKILLLWWKAVHSGKKKILCLKSILKKTLEIWLWLDFDVRTLEPSAILEWAGVINMEYQKLNQEEFEMWGLWFQVFVHSVVFISRLSIPYLAVSKKNF